MFSWGGYAYAGWRRAIDRSNEAIPTPSERFDEHRSFRRFAQRITQPFDRRIQAVIEINKGVVWPKFLAQFLPANKFSRSLKQRRQYLQRLLLQLYVLSPVAQFAGLKINLEPTEVDD